MKILLSILILLSVINVQAGDVELSWGESITIGSTQVTCGPSNTNSCSDDENPYVVCINKGYQPSTCAVLTNGCDSGQVACLNKGYQPSTCANGSGEDDSGNQSCEDSNNPYIVCIDKGYQPSTCAVLTNGCDSG
ncbi:MAG: hypothetical protein V4596_02770, partial [Bdellovibrionota bacterium]